MTDSTVTMRDWWTGHYLTAARNAYPDLCATHKLAVGWKLTHPDGTTHAGYYWPLVNAEHDIPVAHATDNWDAHNSGSCPSRPGDGLCLVESGANVVPASSGGVPLACSVGHVLVWPVELARSDEAGKWRAPWVVDVDCFRPLDLIRVGFMSANLAWANLAGANLSVANLAGANLYRADLYRADLAGADLTRANLSGANLTRADLYGATLYGADLAGAYLSGANLDRADLAGADLTRANLTRADLYRATLYGANLYRANLTGANLYRANLTGANLYGAYGAPRSWPTNYNPTAAGWTA